MIATFTVSTRDEEVLAFWRRQASWQHAANQALAAYFG